MSNEKNSQNKSGELKKPPYVTRTNQPWTTVFAEDLNKKKEEDTPAETKLDLSQFVKVEKVQDDKSTTIPAPVSEAEKDKADTVNKGNVQNVTPMTFKTEDLHMEDGALDSALLQIKQTYGEHTTVDRAAQEGDCVTVDYTGSYNGDEFPNGSAKDAEIVLGQGYYVDGFESQIEGHFAGEKFDITVTFPDSYPDTTDSEGNTLSLAGQDVQFRIELKDVSEPTLTDDSIVNCFGDNKYYTEDGTLVNSVDTFKQYYNELLTKDALGLAIYNYMMDNSVVSEIPQNLIDDQRDTYRKEIEASAENMGKTMDEYLETTDYDTEDALLDSYNDRIDESVKAYLIFQAVAEAEKIKVTDADVSDYFGDDSLSVQQAQKYYGEEYVNQTVLYNKVGDWLTAHATIA